LQFSASSTVILNSLLISGRLNANFLSLISSAPLKHYPSKLPWFPFFITSFILTVTIFDNVSSLLL
jgi:hypothetical protein